MAEDTVNNEKITTRSLIKQYFVRWRLLILAAALFAGGVLLWAHTLPLQYTGTAKFTRRKGPVTAGASLRGSESFESRKESLKYDLASREAVEEAVELLGLTKNMERNPEDGGFTSRGQSAKQQLVNEFSKKITINWEVSSAQIDLVSVSFTHSDQDLAKEMPNELVNNYINRVLEQAVDNLSKNKDFLARSVKNCNDQLIKLIEERIKFEKENQGVLPDSPGTLYERILQVNADLDTVRLRYLVAIQQLKGLQGFKQSLTGLAEDPNEPREIIMGPNPELARLEGELRQAKNTLDQYLVVRRMKDNHPDVQTIQREITRLEERIKETEPMAVASHVYGRSADDPALAIQLLQTKATVDGTQGEINRLENRLAAYESMLIDFPTKRKNYLKLTNDIENKQAELTRWQEKLQSVDMALAAEIVQKGTLLDTVQAAQKQFRPSEPDLWKVIGIAVMGGLAFGGVLVFLAIRMDQSVITPEQAAKGFGIPVYGFVGVIMTPRKLFFRSLKRWVVLPIVSLILMAALGLLTYSLTLRLHYPEKYEKQIVQNVNKVITEAKYIGWEAKETLSGLWD